MTPPPSPLSELFSSSDRILIISSAGLTPWGGSEALWASAAEALLKRTAAKVFAHVKRWPQDPPRISELKQLGLTVLYRQSGLLARARDRLLPYSEYDALLDRVRPTLVILSNGGNLPSAQLAMSLLYRNLFFASVSHSNGANAFPNPEDINILENFLRCSLANCFVAHEHVELLERQLGIRPPNVNIVRNPVKFSVTPPPDDYSDYTDPRETRLACVATLQPSVKGQDLLLAALAANRWRKREWRLSLFGVGGHELVLRRLIQHYDLSKHVDFMGYVTEIESIWKTHDALVLTSRKEGLPLSVLEAMSFGRPAIVTDVGDMARIVEDGTSGFVAPAATPKFVADTLERAWQARASWPDMGRRARKFALSFVPTDPGGDFLSIIGRARAQRDAVQGVSTKAVTTRHKLRRALPDRTHLV